MVDPNEAALLPFTNARFQRVFQLFQNRRMEAIEASPDRINRFRSFLNRALNELLPERGIRNIINEADDEQHAFLQEIFPNREQNLNEFYGQRE